MNRLNDDARRAFLRVLDAADLAGVTLTYVAVSTVPGGTPPGPLVSVQGRPRDWDVRTRRRDEDRRLPLADALVLADLLGGVEERRPPTPTNRVTVLVLHPRVKTGRVEILCEPTYTQLVDQTVEAVLGS